MQGLAGMQSFLLTGRGLVPWGKPWHGAARLGAVWRGRDALFYEHHGVVGSDRVSRGLVWRGQVRCGQVRLDSAGMQSFCSLHGLAPQG